MAKTENTKRDAIDRLPPHDVKAEIGILGCAMLDPVTCLPELATVLSPEGNEFYDLRHRTIYTELLALAAADVQVDIITLSERLNTKKLMEQIGGLPFLAGLPDQVPSAANLKYYLEIVKEKHLLRSMASVCTSSLAKCYEADGDVTEAIDEIEREILAVRKFGGRAGPIDVKAMQRQLMIDMEAALQRGGPAGLLSGFPDLDYVAGGMIEQEVIVVTGRQSSGKTSLALNIAWNLACQEVKVAVVSLETSGKKIVHRFNCMAGRVNGQSFFRGTPNEGEFTRMTTAIASVVKRSDYLMVLDQELDSLEAIGAQVRRCVQQGARAVVLDYLQLLPAKGRSQEERISEASKWIKRLAKTNNIPVLVISSLNRSGASDNTKPTMADVRGSGQIEYDADKMYILHCEEPDADVRRVMVDVAKNKDGSTGDVALNFYKSEYRFGDAPRISE